MWAVVVVEVLPFGQLLIEIDVTRVRQQLIEFLLAGPMRPLYLSVELWRPGLDVDVPDAVVGQVPMKLGLYHSEFRYMGRPVGRRRLIGTTLLVKGLEFDHAIVFDAASLSRKELYVALTRGARSLTIIFTIATLDPAD